MTERFRQIEALYHAALELDPPRRAVFLESACGTDQDLRREVESLLAYSKLSESFIETPALAAITKQLVKQRQEQETVRCDEAKTKKD